MKIRRGRVQLVVFRTAESRSGVLFELGGAIWLYLGARGIPRLTAALHLGFFSVAVGYDLRRRGER